MKCEVMERISPEKAVQLLADDGIYVDAAQAKIIVDFLYEMADIAVDQYLDQSGI